MIKHINLYKSSGFRKSLLFFFILAIVGFSFVSCGQDSIFAQIADEEPPKKPRIPGFPANIVVARASGGDHVFAAGTGSRKIHYYRQGNWTEEDAPENSVIALASNGETLFALCGNHFDANLYRRGDSGWPAAPITKPAEFSPQAIFAAGTYLFVGGRTGTNYSIYYMPVNGNSLTLLTPNQAFDNNAELKGAALMGGNYFIAAGTNGIFRFTPPGSSITKINIESSHNITGIAAVSNRLIAVSWGGRILSSPNGTTFSQIGDSSVSFTGGICVLNNNSLLLLGTHSTANHNKGYREIPVASLASTSVSIRIPGNENPSTIGTESEQKHKYEATIARNSVYSILQVPSSVETPASGSQAVIFAATARGLQSLREGAWNAEP